MGEARTVLDRMTESMVAGDTDALSELYAEDAIAVTPDLGEVKGRQQVVDYLEGFASAFSERRYEPIATHEAGETAIDEGYFVGTHTGPLPMPSGETVPATGKTLRLRACDVATIRNGMVVSHHFYYDQLDFMNQLGLTTDMPA